MITCDRCGATITPNEFIMLGGLPIDRDIVACEGCNQSLRTGLDKITDDITAEHRERCDRWRNEWLRNFNIKERKL